MCARAQVMAERLTNSKSLIEEWMDPARGNRHFTKWIKDKQRKAIRTCGLSLSNYTNKSKRTEILTHLASTELPINPGAVMSELHRLSINYAGASSRQQFAYVLLREITTAGELPVLYVTRAAIVVTAPTRDNLATVARDVLKTHIFDSHHVPCT